MKHPPIYHEVVAWVGYFAIWQFIVNPIAYAVIVLICAP